MDPFLCVMDSQITIFTIFLIFYGPRGSGLDGIVNYNNYRILDKEHSNEFTIKLTPPKMNMWMELNVLLIGKSKCTVDN